MSRNSARRNRASLLRAAAVVQPGKRVQRRENVEQVDHPVAGAWRDVHVRQRTDAEVANEPVKLTEDIEQALPLDIGQAAGGQKILEGKVVEAGLLVAAG